jgi:hypothetical protein
MEWQARWERLKMTCPEGMGDSELLAEWRHEAKGISLNSVCCKNPKLRDLSGVDCQWACWKEISNEAK